MSERFSKALILATEAHTGQVRKGATNTAGVALPYITHPVGVAALTQRYGGDEDQVIAALLHDVLEDAGAHWAARIEAEFGPRVLAMVEACTDGTPDASGQKAPWEERKRAYLAHLAEAKPEALLVSACDKLYNLQAILLDLTETGPQVFERFTASREGTLWYYGELVRAFVGKVPAPLLAAMERDLGAIHARLAPGADESIQTECAGSSRN